MFVKLTDEQLEKKIAFIRQYMEAPNAATGSLVDANANVTAKNIATLGAELHKDANIQINRKMIYDKLLELYDLSTANKYLAQIQNHTIYVHDESGAPGMPYCVAIDMLPFLADGLKHLGGESKKPKHLDSFCGSFVNLVLSIASQFAGACATPQLFVIFDLFARMDLGENYLEHYSKLIENRFQWIVYCLNQPAASRSYQSVFWNISLFDKYFYEYFFQNFTLFVGNGISSDWESFNKLQKFFISWLNQERTKALLTFPVVTATMLTGKDRQPADRETAEFLAGELAEGNSFFVYQSDSVDSLASCCRLRSQVNTKEFTSTLGNIGIMTGSIRVITLNVNRFIQKIQAIYQCHHNPELMAKLQDELADEISLIHKFHHAHRELIKEFEVARLLPVYDAGFISLGKQYSTIGLNGLVEAAEFCGIRPGNNEQYIKFMSDIMRIIFETNKKGVETFKFKINTEYVPAENLGVKNAKWDKEDGFFSPRDCYNSYFYPVENDGINILDKFILHGERLTKYLDGGSALHLNLEDHLTKEQYLDLFQIAINTGCNYWCVNVLATVCNDCDHIAKRKLPRCPSCNSENIDYATRIIGYLKKISSFSIERQKEAKKRVYHRNEVSQG